MLAAGTGTVGTETATTQASEVPHDAGARRQAGSARAARRARLVPREHRRGTPQSGRGARPTVACSRRTRRASCSRQMGSSCTSAWSSGPEELRLEQDRAGHLRCAQQRKRPGAWPAAPSPKHAFANLPSRAPQVPHLPPEGGAGRRTAQPRVLPSPRAWRPARSPARVAARASRVWLPLLCAPQDAPPLTVLQETNSNAPAPSVPGVSRNPNGARVLIPHRDHVSCSRACTKRGRTVLYRVFIQRVRVLRRSALEVPPSNQDHAGGYQDQICPGR